METFYRLQNELYSALKIPACVSSKSVLHKNSGSLGVNTGTQDSNLSLLEACLMQCKFYCLLIAVSVWFRCCYADTRRKSVNSESPFIAVATNAFGDQSTPKKPESKPEFTYFKDLSDCPLCNASKRQTLQSAVESFWRNELFDAFACACTYLQTKPDDGHAVSIIQAITQGKPPFIALEAKLNPLQRPAPPLRKWEVLGPINVGKLEHDADSTFMKEHVFPSYSKDALDVGSYILGMPSNATALSELATGGAVKWSTFNGNEAGEVGFAQIL